MSLPATPEEVYRAYHGYVVRTVVRRGHWRYEDVEDAAHTSFERLLKVWERLTPDGVRNYWWLSCWREMTHKQTRGWGRYVTYIEGFEEELSPIERLAVVEDPDVSDVEAVFTMLATLTAKQAQVLLLVASGYSHKEVAELAGCGVSVVSSHLARARSKLRPTIQPKETQVPETEFYVDEAGEHRWRVKADNGEIVATGEGHTSRADAERAFLTARANLEEAEAE